MIFTLEEATAYRDELALESLDQLQERFSTLANTQFAIRFTLSDADYALMLMFFSDFELNAPLQLAGYTVIVHQKLDKGDELDINDIKTLQKLLLETKFKNVSQAIILSKILKVLEPINIELLRIEESFRHLSDFIARKEQENLTGLQHKEGDAELANSVEHAGLVKAEKPAKSGKAAKMKKV